MENWDKEHNQTRIPQEGLMPVLLYTNMILSSLEQKINIPYNIQHYCNIYQWNTIRYGQLL